MKGSSRKKSRSVDAAARSGYERLRANPDERTVKWRFHRAADRRWRWQKVSGDESIMAESTASFPTYAECVADAATAGYQQLPTTTGLIEPR